MLRMPQARRPPAAWSTTVDAGRGPRVRRDPRLAARGRRPAAHRGLGLPRRRRAAADVPRPVVERGAQRRDETRRCGGRRLFSAFRLACGSLDERPLARQPAASPRARAAAPRRPPRPRSTRKRVTTACRRGRPHRRTPRSSAPPHPRSCPPRGPVHERTAAARTRRSARSTRSSVGEVHRDRGPRRAPARGTLGDILALRAQARGAAGIVTDGGVRDFDAVAAIGLPGVLAGRAPRRARPPARAVGRRRHDRVRRRDGAAGRHHRRRRRRRHRHPARPSPRRSPTTALAQEVEDAWIAEQVAAGSSRRRPVPDERGVACEVRSRHGPFDEHQGPGQTQGPQASTVPAASKSEQAYDWIRARIAAARVRPRLSARARPDRRGARHERRAGARGDPPARGRGARDLRAQRRRPGHARRRDRVRRTPCRRSASSRGRRPRCRRRCSPPSRPRPRRPRSTSGCSGLLDALRRRTRSPSLNRRFHSVLFEPCPNPHLLDLVHRGLVAALRHPRFHVRLRAAAGLSTPCDEHIQILELIRDGRRPARDRARRTQPPLAHEGRVPRGAAHARTHNTPGEILMTDSRIPADLPDRIQHYIDGAFVDSVDGDTFDVLDPVTEPDVHDRPRPARRPTSTSRWPRRSAPSTEGPWPRMLPRERSRVLHRIADIVESRDARLAELESFDSGLPITQALGQARRAAENFRFFADLIVAQADDALQGARPADELRQPQADRRRRADHAVEHAVHAGVVEARPRAGDRQHGGAQARRVHAAVGIAVGRHLRGGRAAEGRLQPRQRPRRGCRRRAREAPRRDRSSRSRARAAPGRSSSATPRRSCKGLSMELGGKSPAVVFADADLEAAVDATIFGAFPQRRALHRRFPHHRRALDLRGVRRALRRAGEAREGRATRTTPPPRWAPWCTPSTTTR